MITHSATLAANEHIRARIAAGEDIVHLAFGEAGLPAHPALEARLSGATHRNDYPAVVGDPAARASCARYFERRDLPTEPDQIVLAPGSKALLYALLLAVPGDVVLPQPSWVSYAAQAALAQRRTLPVPIPPAAGGVPDPQLLPGVLDQAVRDGRRPGTLVLTRPDNPTGTVAGDELLRQVCEIAERHDLLVIADEIYADLSHDGSYPTSAATLLSERTVITTGLSKRLALGGWRIGVARIPDGPYRATLTDHVIGIGSEIWSSMPGPMQDVAAYAFGEPAELVEYVADARRLHAAVAREMWSVWTDAGAQCRAPQGGFYLYPDLGPHADRLAGKGITNSTELADALLGVGIGVLPGAAFGDDPSRLTARVATSLLYGSAPEQRLEALASTDPARLPWIADALAKTRDGLARLLA